MRKYGKYEKRPEGVPVTQPKVKRALLQTYLTSLLCMVLCVTMFFGTSYAWFTSEVTNTGNEIYIGVLDVGLEKRNGNNWDSLSATENGVNTSKLYSNAIRWEPGYTSVETVRVVNQGDLAFNYALSFADGMPDGAESTKLHTVAQWFDVWVYHDENNTIPKDLNYEQITEENGWKKVGTLADALNGKLVFEGKMNQAEVAGYHTYTIALHMKEDADSAVMGQKITLNVKLVAYQTAFKNDDSNSND